jgi:hypothetical protein
MRKREVRRTTFCLLGHHFELRDVQGPIYKRQICTALPVCAWLYPDGWLPGYPNLEIIGRVATGRDNHSNDYLGSSIKSHPTDTENSNRRKGVETD